MTKRTPDKITTTVEKERLSKSDSLSDIFIVIGFMIGAILLFSFIFG